MILYESTISVQKKMDDVDLFEDNDHLQETHSIKDFKWMDLWKFFLNILLDKECMLYRSANIVHALGSVTVSKGYFDVLYI